MTKYDRNEMQQYIKEFVTRDHIIKQKVCKHIDVSIPTMNRILANDPKVSMRTIWTTYLLIKDMA